MLQRGIILMKGMTLQVHGSGIHPVETNDEFVTTQANVAIGTEVTHINNQLGQHYQGVVCF